MVDISNFFMHTIFAGVFGKEIDIGKIRGVVDPPDKATSSKS